MNFWTQFLIYFLVHHIRAHGEFDSSLHVGARVQQAFLLEEQDSTDFGNNVELPPAPIRGMECGCSTFEHGVLVGFIQVQVQSEEGNLALLGPVGSVKVGFTPIPSAELSKVS